MTTAELIKRYDDAKAIGADLSAFASLRGMSREQIKAALEKYERLVTFKAVYE